MSNLDQSTIISDVHQFVLNTTFGNKEKITNSSFLFKDGYFDSMGFVALIAFLEEKYKVKVNDDELLEENFESIQAIADFVSKKLN
jgi:acyl carrier protein